MEYLACFQQLSDQGAILCSKVDCGEEVKELRIVFAELLKGIFQRKMP
ncbi:MAG: hypothetical protein WC291_09410 [Thermodesulfovibrionales bacterium]|jgi:hypothetical protein